MRVFTGFSLACLFLPVTASCLDSEEPLFLHSFEKLQLSDEFYAEGTAVGDFNRDGHVDVVGGPFWYEGPDFKRRHEYYPARAFDPLHYSDHFITFVYDFNGDGWDDILVIGWPGTEAFWFENSQGAAGHWKRHLAFESVDNESPAFGDLTGNGKPELVFHTGGRLGWAEPNWENPEQPWRFRPLSPQGSWQRYTHGLGFGDVNGDGRVDFLEKDGWWEQPPSLEGDPLWVHHPAPLGTRGGAQMYVYDVNGDGYDDIITSLDGHGWGLAWFEQVREGGRITFRPHTILGEKHEDSPYGVRFSQLHAVALVDIDADGLKDIVTGKRFWAHGPEGDVEPNAPAVLYWFKLVQFEDGDADFIPYLIDEDSGVGTQVVAADVSGNGLPDVVVSNKKGTFVFLNEAKRVSREEWEKAQPAPGTRSLPAGASTASQGPG